MIYVLDYKEQVRRTNEMVTVRKNTETMEMYYHDPSTGMLWKSFFPRYTPKSKGPKLLRPEPLPDNLESQLEECLNSTEKDDAVGLGIELSVYPENWANILTLLKKNSRKYLRSNFFSFLNHSGLLNPRETLHEIGQKPEYYGLTPKELKNLKKRARFLKFRRFLGI